MTGHKETKVAGRDEMANADHNKKLKKRRYHKLCSSGIPFVNSMSFLPDASAAYEEKNNHGEANF